MKNSNSNCRPINIALIPARGGSKRIPRKNIKNFAGKPMLSWPIKAAKRSKLFNAIAVSSDDDDVLDIAESYGVDHLLKRPKYLADDITPLRPVIRQSIIEIEKKIGKIDNLCCIYATAALLVPDDLVKGYACLDNPSSNYSVSSAVYPHPIQRSFFRRVDGGLIMSNPEARNTRTQDLKDHYYDAGMFFWGRRNAFFSDKSIYTESSNIVVIPRLRAIDIDELEDWEMAESIFQQLKISQ
jgi:pseudaminic acid cytidylyltransferase